jgi:hypothetical protein
MSETSSQRGSRHRGDVVRCEPGRAIDLRESDRDKPRRVATWAPALAAVVLLDPSALPGPRFTPTQVATARQRAGARAASVRPPTDGDRAADPASDSSPATGRAAGRDVPTVLAVVDAAAALIEAGDDDSAFLLLALAGPAPDRPAGAHDALRLLTNTRPRAATCVPPSRRSTAPRLRRRGRRGGWRGPA